MDANKKYIYDATEKQSPLEIILFILYHVNEHRIERAVLPGMTAHPSVMASHDPLGDIFADPPRAARNLHAVLDLFITSGSHYTLEQFSQLLDEHLRVCPDPDMAVTNLLRFSEATLNKASLYNDLVKYRVMMEVLVKLFGTSQYFADILVRDPELFRWLTGTDSLLQERTRDILAQEVDRVREMFPKPERCLDALKRLYRRELLRIGARDILGEADLRTTTRELSLLADAVVQACCHVAEQQLNEKYAHPPETRYAVIGLGKLGGEELNYSSDIDILLVYEDEGELKDAHGRTVTHHEFFNKFAEQLVQDLSQSTADGHLYRVDMRLRPESGAGPLARSLQSYLLYYESRGELWERQMLIKGRPVAGEYAFGREFLEHLEPFVYPRSFFHHPAEKIARIKARIEASVSGEENIKLRPGGIRDIEFIVQTLQLINGGKVHTIREGNTLNAIQRLGEVGFLTSEEVNVLEGAYRFFRTIEHRLQTMLNTQTHTIPSDLLIQRTLARRIGVDSPDQLALLMTGHLQAVRDIFQSVLAPDPAEKTAGLTSLLEGAVQGETAEHVLSSYGFQNIRQASKNLAFMLSGSSLTTVRDFDVREREAFRLIADDLFAEIRESPSPDMTLRNLTTLIAAQKFVELFYVQLKEPNFRRLILAICGMSPRLAKGLARNPPLLEDLALHPEASPVIQVPQTAEPGRVAQLKTEGELRAATRNLLGLTRFTDFTEELSGLADSVLHALFLRECKKKRLKDVPLAVLALGKYGTREISLDADLDLLFVSDPSSRAGQESLERLASAFVSTLSAFYDEGKLYDIDARLRPEGKNAPLVVDVGSYGTYLRSRASLWERQSLTRLRHIAGDRALGERVITNVETFVYETPLPASWVETILEMRRKIETRSRTRSCNFFDLKLGPGGIVDVEFLAQMIQLQFGRKHPEIRSLKTLDLLDVAGKRWFTSDELTPLANAYRSMREVEKLLRLTLEEKGTVLPEGEKLEVLARCFDGSSGSSLREQLLSMAGHTRDRFLAMARKLQSMGES
jgi:glutamate-ammonia-ligase adenylyltransferase